MIISAGDEEYLLNDGGTVVDTETGREGTVLVLGAETAFVDFGALFGCLWVPYEELEFGRLR